MPSTAENAPAEAILHQEIARLRDQLDRAERMSALGELLSTTTHEFNNILTTIINYAKLGLRNKDSESRDKALDRILNASQRAAKITTSVLGMARNRSGGFESTDLVRVVDDALLLLEREMNKYRVHLERDIQSPVPEVWANGNQIQQVLLNLLVNARQAMPNGGRLLLRIAYDASKELVDLTVRDTGVGIPQEQLPRIFDPFFTTKNGPDESGKGGTGLGLAACREIVEAHHGRIRVESAVGVGTAITIRLPIAKPAGT